MATRMRNRIVCAASALILTGALGCASTPIPGELADARRAYAEAQAGPAASLEQAKLYEAKKALTRAEQAFEEDPEAQSTRDLAYIASRKAQQVQALGSLAYASRQITKARADYMALQSQLQNKTQEELSQARQQIATGQQQLAVGQEQLAAERLARVQAEQRAKEAMSKLAEVATVKEEPNRGTVITLSGAVLFTSGQSTLLSTAREKLNQVAIALKESSDQTILVEGFTDSRGSATLNENLSQRRAQAVRDYLVSQGIPAERVRATGRGPSNPIADNASAEGRANNRRVEIVVEPAGRGSAGTTPGTGTGTMQGSGTTQRRAVVSSEPRLSRQSP